VSAATVSPQVEQLRKQLEGLSERLDSATSKTAQLEASNAQLEQALSAASQQARLNSVESDLQRDASKAANAQVAALRQQLDDARSKMVTLDAVASAQEKQTTEAQARVASLKAEMDQMYAARNTAETMISSRNLHIIDVYDDNGRGGRQGAFGRVFYVEGKSLVFYAYDLPNPKRGQNFSFQLWGEGQGLEPTTYKLGLMHPDTAAHGRWVVSCDDPKILGQLRGIFIAPASPKGDPPSPSQKLMYALLGSANHP
jgi:ABC-type transporter Mla subunit MlaD